MTPLTKIRHAFKMLRFYEVAVGYSGVIVYLTAKLFRTRFLAKAKAGGIMLRVPSTDVSVYRQVFDERQYDAALPFEPRLIIDAGANNGCSAIFFARKYPGAEIIAIEMEKGNYDLMARNVAQYRNIRPMHAALWSSESEITMVDPGLGAHGYRVGSIASREGIRVPAVTIDRLLQESRSAGFEKIDLLKMDIEGAEIDVFRTSQDWIGSVRAIMIELHGPACATAMAAATGRFKSTGNHGEIEVLIAVSE